MCIGKFHLIFFDGLPSVRTDIEDGIDTLVGESRFDVENKMGAVMHNAAVRSERQNLALERALQRGWQHIE